jgi:antitoxin component of RelBE/YafQ-DinJ toxin-antitoxin module
MSSFIKKFTDFASFGISEARIPIKEVKTYHANKLQLESLKKIISDRQGAGPSLAALREPDLSRVNYMMQVRGGVEAIWRQLFSSFEDIPAPHLLDYLDRAWIKAQQQIDETAQKEARQIFRERAIKKIEIIKGEAKKLAAEKGIPFVLRWLDSLKGTCDLIREKTAKEQSQYGEQKKKQKKELDELKKEWVKLLGREQGDLAHVARRFLFLAAFTALAGFIIWLFNISLGSFLGTIGILAFILLFLWISRPLIRQLLLSRKFASLSHKLTSGYRVLSFSSLDELAKRIESEYWEELRSHIESVEQEYRQRIIDLKKREEDLEKNLEEVQGCITKNEPTVRRLFTADDLKIWYEQGFTHALAILPKWAEKMADLNEAISWQSFDSQALECFDFLETLSAETQLYRHYPDKDERMKYLHSLREAILGTTEAEAFASLDLSSTAGRPEVHLLIGINDPQNSRLARELHEAWGNTGVGLVITESVPHAITMISLISGFPFTALQEYPDVESAFEKIKAKEGKGIYPVLFAEDMEGSE